MENQMKKMAYDEEVLVNFASTLYKSANNMVSGGGFLGFVLGIAIGYLITDKGSGPIYMISGAVIGVVIGLVFAEGMSTNMRIQAQALMCQVQIEKNTRR